MKKSELKTGMVVTQRSGREGQVMLGTSRGDCIYYLDEGRNDLSYWDKDMTSSYSPTQDIMKVTSPNSITKPREGQRILWTRPEPPVVYTLSRNDGKAVKLSAESFENLKGLFGESVS